MEGILMRVLVNGRQGAEERGSILEGREIVYKLNRL
jgi:hypothetical protein